MAGAPLVLLLITSLFCAAALDVALEEEDPSGLITSCRFGGWCPGSDIIRLLQVNATAIQESIDKLATYSDTPPPSVTRILYSDNDVAARGFVRELMKSAQLTVREDAVGNIFGRWEGSEPEASAVASGSHTDAIPYAGKYDGVVGVVGAIEALRALRSSGFQPRKSLEVIMFTSEEPTRFGLSCLGSRVLSGDPNLAHSLKHAVDEEGITFADAARNAGYDKCDNLGAVLASNSTYAAFVELHIEQGPHLEAQGLSAGIVTAIAGPASFAVEFSGDGGHAGAVLMHNRNDAGLAAAELALAVEKHVLESGSEDTVGTTGVMKVHPGAVNSIPRLSQLGIDVRDTDGERRDGVVERIKQSAASIASRRKVRLTKFETVNQDPPAKSAGIVVEAAREAAQQLRLNHRMMVSRAYHDSLFMSRIAPTGMIFIPCFKGYSHRPDEHATLQDISNGVQLLAVTLAKLSS